MVSYFLSQNSFFKVHVFIIQKYVNLNQKVNDRVGQRKFGCIHYFDSFDITFSLVHHQQIFY